MSESNNAETPESTESFDQLLSEYEQAHARPSQDGARQLEGTVVAVTAESVLPDIGGRPAIAVGWQLWDRLTWHMPGMIY